MYMKSLSEIYDGDCHEEIISENFDLFKKVKSGQIIKDVPVKKSTFEILDEDDFEMFKSDIRRKLLS